MIRAVAAVAFTALVALKLSATIFCWPVTIVGIAFAGWTIYSHLLSKDPLMETFYKILGGKNRFERLPEINLAQVPNEKISQAISRLNWDNLSRPIYRTRTLDGRNVIIVKGLSRTNDGNGQTKGVFAFIEKLRPEDMPRHISNLSEFAHVVMHAILAPHEGNTLGQDLYSYQAMRGAHNSIRRDNNYQSRCCGVYSSISSDMANELFAQMATKEDD